MMYACKQHPVEAIGPVPEAHLVCSIKGKCLTFELDGKQLETIVDQEAVLEHNRFLVLNAGSLRYGLCRIRQNSFFANALIIPDSASSCRFSSSTAALLSTLFILVI